MKLTLLVKEITDSYVRDNFQRLKDWATSGALFKMDPSFFEIQVQLGAAAVSVSNFRFPHRLGYTPKDIIMTSAIGSGTITWNYENFDSTYLDLSITGATAGSLITIRVLVGNIA